MPASELTFCDFSHLDPDGSADASIQRGKFVQLRHKEAGEVIAFAPLNVCAFHAQIVHLYCNRQQPPWTFELNARGDDGSMHESDACIIGGGYLEIYNDIKRLSLSGSSKAYGSYNPIGLPEKLLGLPRFHSYKIIC